MNPLCRFLGFIFVLAVSARATPQPLVLDRAESTIAIDVKATVDSFTAQLNATELVVSVESSTAAVTTGRIAFKFADLKTGKPDRDAAMHAWQDTPHFPDVVFQLKMVTPMPDGSLVATGDFTLHGQTHSLSFPVKIQHTGRRYTIDGQADFDTRDYGLPVIRKFAVLKVNPELHVRFHLAGDVSGT